MSRDRYRGRGDSSEWDDEEPLWRPRGKPGGSTSSSRLPAYDPSRPVQRKARFVNLSDRAAQAEKAEDQIGRESAIFDIAGVAGGNGVSAPVQREESSLGAAEWAERERGLTLSGVPIRHAPDIIRLPVQRRASGSADIDAPSSDSLRDERSTIEADAPTGAPANDAGDLDVSKGESLSEERATIAADAESAPGPLSPARAARAARRNPALASRHRIAPADFATNAAPNSAAFAQAVAAMQGEHGLAVDGLVGPRTAAVVRNGRSKDDADVPGEGDTRGAGSSLLQMKATGPVDEEGVHQAAAAGVATGAGALPHLDSIQDAFGAHDVSGVQAHVGGPAASASEAIGAEAYATGNHVAFRQSPDLHTAAHEAAHVVQQRGGVQLKGGVGASGDSYERHADQVADGVVRGDRVEGLLDAVAGQSSPAQSSAAVQRYDSDEHKYLGDAGNGGNRYKWGGGQVPFTLTHGDIISLTGDYFSPNDEDGDDALFVLAGRPSAKPGTEIGTQDEILWALKKMHSDDPRFGPKGVWGSLQFSGEIKAAVEKRYNQRAKENRDHFAAPEGEDLFRRPVHGGWTSSATSAYRRHHENAMSIAFEEGRKADGGNIARAQVREAAAQHFLTDMFSSGHIRTPRAGLQAYWDYRAPQFFVTLASWVTSVLVKDLRTDMRIAGWVPERALSTGVYVAVRKAFAAKAEYGLGDILSYVAHSFDNETGLDVINENGQKWMAHGDDMLLKDGNVTQDGKDDLPMILKAVELGLRDVQYAYDLGRLERGSSAPSDMERVLAEIRANPGDGIRPNDDLYGPEVMTPRLRSAAPEAELKWKTGRLEDLWPVLMGKGATWGERTKFEMSAGGIYNELKDGRASMTEPIRVEPKQQTLIKSVSTGLGLESLGNSVASSEIDMGAALKAYNAFLSELKNGQILDILVQLANGRVPQ